MNTNPAQVALLFAVCLPFLAGCDKSYPECVEVAAAVGRIGLSEAAKTYDADSKEMKSLKEQVAAQQAKVTKDCNAKIAGNKSIWLPWAKCMAGVSTADEARKCKDMAK
jgi:hypothetical protein